MMNVAEDLDFELFFENLREHTDVDLLYGLAEDFTERPPSALRGKVMKTVVWAILQDMGHKMGSKEEFNEFMMLMPQINQTACASFRQAVIKAVDRLHLDEC